MKKHTRRSSTKPGRAKKQRTRAAGPRAAAARKAARKKRSAGKPSARKRSARATSPGKPGARAGRTPRSARQPAPPTRRRVAVIAIGGNSLIKDAAHQTVPDQFSVTRETAAHIATMLERGWEVVITHGNGPQIGFIMRRSELAMHELHPVPMDSAGADTQGAIGYMIQQCLVNELARRDLQHQATTVVTQVLVDHQDPAFANPSKPIGSFMDQATAELRARDLGWNVVEDAGRGWRRVVASPLPVEIVELEAIRALLASGISVVAVGGGGIPVVREDGQLKGVAAVIDKDYASALLASALKADLFVISTAVPQACLYYGTPQQRPLDRITLAQAKEYLAQGHFARGSMGPKVQAVINFIEAGGGHAIITDPAHIVLALDGQAGTHVVRA